MSEKPLTRLEMYIISLALNAYDDSDVITAGTLIAKIESLNALYAENTELKAKWASVPWEALEELAVDKEGEVAALEATALTKLEKFAAANLKGYVNQVRAFLDANRPQEPQP